MYVSEPQRKGQDLNHCQFCDMGHRQTCFVFLFKNSSLIKCQYEVFVGFCLNILVAQSPAVLGGPVVILLQMGKKCALEEWLEVFKPVGVSNTQFHPMMDPLSLICDRSITPLKEQTVLS